jgi:hypothetical protein
VERPYEGIETVTIVPFTNNTAEFDLADRITVVLIYAIDGGGLLKLRSQGADSEISGTLERVERSVHTYTETETPEEYRYTIRVRIVFKDLKQGKTLWESSIEGFGTYSADTDDKDAQTEAINLLNQRIQQRIMEG